MVYWIWVVAELIALFLFIRIGIWLLLFAIGKLLNIQICLTGFGFLAVAQIRLITSRLNIELNDVSLGRVRSGSGFALVHVKFISCQVDSISQQQNGTTTDNGAGRKRKKLKFRVISIAARALLKVFQLSVGKAEVAIRDVKCPSLGYLDLIQFPQGGVVSRAAGNSSTVNVLVDIRKLSYSSWVTFDPNDANDTYRLIEVCVSLSLELSVCVGAINGRWIETVLLDSNALDVQLEAVSISHLLKRFTNSGVTNPSVKNVSIVDVLPKKVEAHVAQSSVKCLSSTDNRCLEIGASTTSLNMTSEGSMAVTVNVKKLYVRPDVVSHCAVQLKQIHCHFKLKEDVLDVGVTLTSLRVTIDQHLSHWYTQFKSIAPTMKGDGQTTPSRPHPFLPSVSIVLSAELSDCLVTTEVCLVGVAKECQLVSASSALRATLSTTDHTHNRSASLSYRVVNTYLYVPVVGGVRDDPSLLPSNQLHHKGRVFSVGSSTVNVATPTLCRGNANFNIELKGETWILAWSDELIAMATKLLQFFPRKDSSSSDGNNDYKVDLHLNGLNVLLISTDALCVMTRVDSVHLTDAILTMYGVAVDQLNDYQHINTVQCVSVVNMLSGSIVSLDQIDFTKRQKVVDVNILKPIIEWTPGLHMTIMTTVKTVSSQIDTAITKLSTSSQTQPPQQFTKQSDMITNKLEKIPIILNIEMDECTVNMSFDRKRRRDVSVTLVTGHSSVKEGTASLDVYQVKVAFNNTRHILCLEGLQGTYPHNMNTERKDCCTVKDNKALNLSLLRIEVYLQDDYKFYEVYEQLTNIRKFISSSTPNEAAVSLPVDLLVEIEELVFQVEDNPLEVKLRANYELMTDEAEERHLREIDLEKRLQEIKKDQGRLFSVKLSQNLRDSLNCSNAEIFCQRAREMYCNEPLPTELLNMNMSQVKLVILRDTSLQGRANLLQQITTMDSISGPLPDDYQFSTLWGVYINLSTKHIEVLMRDYPWKLLEGKGLEVAGTLIAAEQEACHDREFYECSVDVGPFWTDNPVITRKLPPLKYYHDLTISSDDLIVSWGPCLDPAFAQINYSFSLLTKPSLDHSPPLPWWDKCRLLLHGKAVLRSQSFSLNLLSSVNPYNENEFLDLHISQLVYEMYNNVSLKLCGAVDVHMFTASRYNKCPLVQLPSVTAEISYSFNCKGHNSHNHHTVNRCLHTKLPVSAEGQEHDSYRLFRSQTMDITLVLQVKDTQVVPNVLLYASTLRWLQKWIVFIRSNISRPIRRGKVHCNVRPKKKRFTRQLRNISLSLTLPKSTVQYWSSVSQAHGVAVEMGGVKGEVRQYLELVNYKDGLTRRPQPVWNVSTLTGDISDLAVYTCVTRQQLERDLSSIDTPAGKEPIVFQNHGVVDPPFEKRVLLQLSSLSYIREQPDDDKTMNFKHQLKTVDSKIVWSDFSRDVMYKLLNSYNLYKRLERDLSSDALKSVFNKSEWEEPDKRDTGEVPVKPLTRHNSGCAMLDQLLSDICNTIVTSEESREPSDPKLKGIVAANGADVKCHDWFIELLQTQIALQGVERKGFIVGSSYIAQVFGRGHTPQLRGGDLVTKNSWVAKVQDLQYFSSIEGDNGQYIPWLPPSTVQPPGFNKGACPDPESLTSLLLSQLGPDLAHPIGVQETMSSRPPGEAVGGVVTSNPSKGVVYDVEEDDTGSKRISVQRIASRCHCQIFYVSYGDVVTSEDTPLNTSVSEKSSSDSVDTFTFRYPSTEVATTSFQYSLIMDIVNNLLLYKEPRRKEKTEQHARMKFMLQLSSLSEGGFRKPILAKQNKIRQIMSRIREIENDLYIEYKGHCLPVEVQRLEHELSIGKDELSQSGVELRAMIRAFKERQLILTSLPQGSDNDSIPAEPTRRIEVWLDDAQWSIMHSDGQLQVSEIRLTNFSYNRLSFSDDSGEHRFELGSFRVKNCMPNTPQAYQEVLSPYDPASRRLRVDKNVSLRIYCRDQAPVAGISVTEHLEVNVVPLAVRLTGRFYNTLQEYFLPRAEAESRELTSEPLQEHPGVLGVTPTYTGESLDLPDGAVHSKGVNKSNTVAASSPLEKKRKHISATRIDDVEIMKSRASKMKTFIYVKFPQTSLCITYKGEGITVKEITDHIVTIPTIEYHNLNLSWRALLLDVKKDYKNAIISQILKSAIGFKETDEKAGLSSPKLGRSTSDIILGKVKEGKAKTRRVFSKHSTSELATVNSGDESDGGGYTPPPITEERDTRRRKLHSFSTPRK